MVIDTTLTFFSSKTTKVPWLRFCVQLMVAVAMLWLTLISLERARTSITWPSDAVSVIGWEDVKHSLGVVLFAAGAIAALVSATAMIIRQRSGIVCRLSHSGIEVSIEQEAKLQIVPWRRIVTLAVELDGSSTVKLDFDFTDQSGTRRIELMLDGSATTKQGIRLADWVIANPITSN